VLLLHRQHGQLKAPDSHKPLQIFAVFMPAILPSSTCAHPLPLSFPSMNRCSCTAGVVVAGRLRCSLLGWLESKDMIIQMRLKAFAKSKVQIEMSALNSCLHLSAENFVHAIECPMGADFLCARGLF